MKAVGMLAVILVVIGALNWGLVGVGYFAGMDLNVVHMILQSVPVVEYVVYIVVGVSALLVAFAHATGKCAMKD